MNDSKNTENKQPFFFDISFWSLLIANIITIAWALKEGWSLALMFWVHFFQNIIMGFFWPAKVFASSVDRSYKKKLQSVTVFLPHYFAIHFLYAISLYRYAGKEFIANFKCILTMTGIFLVSETVSYFAESNLSRARSLSLAKTQLFPYARVIPMHLIMVCGIMLEAKVAISIYYLGAFLVLKAFMDIAMYMVERSRILSNYVTDMFERQRKRGLLDGYFSLGEKQTVFRTEGRELCRFCQRVISKNETAWLIKEKVVCEECYKEIDRLKAKPS